MVADILGTEPNTCDTCDTLGNAKNPLKSYYVRGRSVKRCDQCETRRRERKIRINKRIWSAITLVIAIALILATLKYGGA